MTDAGLARLKGLTGLEELYLLDTTISDRGLEHLRGLTNLRHLALYDTQVTAAGVRELEKSLPKLKASR